MHVSLILSVLLEFLPDSFRCCKHPFLFSRLNRVSIGFLRVCYILIFFHFFVSCFFATSLHFSIIFHGLSSYISSIQSPHDLHSWFLFLCSVFLVRRNTSLQTHNHHSFFIFLLYKDHKMSRDSSLNWPFSTSIYPIFTIALVPGFHESCWGLLTADHDFENRTLESDADAPAVKNVPTSRGDSHRKKIWFHDDFMWWFHGDLIFHSILNYHEIINEIIMELIGWFGWQKTHELPKTNHETVLQAALAGFRRRQP